MDRFFLMVAGADLLLQCSKQIISISLMLLALLRSAAEKRAKPRRLFLSCSFRHNAMFVLFYGETGFGHRGKHRTVVFSSSLSLFFARLLICQTKKMICEKNNRSRSNSAVKERQK